MQVKFSKMQGLGNDFMMLDLVTQGLELTPELIRQWGDRHTGVGFDQLIVAEPPTDPTADFRFRIYNADGSEAQQCGNGLRCFARFIADNQLSPKRRLQLESLAGPLWTRLQDDGQVEAGMGIPTTEPALIPLQSDEPGPVHQFDVDGTTLQLTAISMGNPHAVLFVDNVQQADVAGIGAKLTRHPRFPEGVNVGFCQVVDSSFVRLRVFERGVGETLACGSGACAAMVAGRLAGRLCQRVKVSLPGGKLRIQWAGPGHELTMTGPAALVYEGTLQL